jgi:hypothetical protein
LYRHRWALAASLLVAAGFLAWYLGERHVRAAPVFSATQDAFAASIGAGTSLDELLLVRNRSASSPVLEMSTVPRLAVLHVLAGESDSGVTFDLELFRSSPAPDVSLGRIENVRADAQGMLSAYLDTGAAGTGSFHLRVHRHDPTGAGEAAEYPFEVRQQ